MERQLRYFRSELGKHDVPVSAPMTADEFFAAGGPAAIAGSSAGDDAGVPYESRRVLADKLNSNEETLKTLLANDDRILNVYNQAREKKFVLEAAQAYFNGEGAGAAAFAEETTDEEDRVAYPGQGLGDEFKFEHIMGVLDSTKKQAFERMMHRILRSLTFKIHFSDCLAAGGSDAAGRPLAPIAEDFLDPTTGESVNKVVFIISLRGPTIKDKVERICAAFEAVVHRVDSLKPEALESDRRGTEDDISQTWGLCKGTRSKAKATMHVIAKQLTAWEWTVSSEKAILVEMNKFSSSGGGNMRGVGWIVKRFSNEVADAIKRFPNTLLSHIDKSRGWPKPPTHFFTNKFTSVFQGIVDTYGVPRYREINPALFTAVTFPFLFGVMYGDIGHGTILTCAATYLLVMERSWSKRKLGEMEAMAFGGRYMLFMMGCFAVYAGFIYNDMFSLGLKIFPTGWGPPGVGQNVSSKEFTKTGHLTGEVYEPYPFGLDPTWKVAQNDLTFQNSYKMKLSVIMGVGQMTFGLFLRLGNSIYSVFKKDEGVGEGWIDIIFECIPQLVFMIGIFGYLNLLIFIKWFTDWDVAQQCGQGVDASIAFYDTDGGGAAWLETDTHRCDNNQVATNLCKFPLGSSYPTINDPVLNAGNDMFGCNQAPAGIILMLISMVLKPWAVVNPLYAYQKYVQWLLLALAGIAIPMMLIPKPIILHMRYSKAHAAEHSAHGESEGGEADGLTAAGAMSYDDDAEAKDMLELPEDPNDSHETHSLADLFIHQIIETIEFVLGCISNTASYLRLWALSLAHAQLAATFWNMVMVKMININKWCVACVHSVPCALLLLLWVPSLSRLTYHNAYQHLAPFSHSSSHTNRYGFIGVFLGYYMFAGITLFVLLMMDVLECFLHALRLHWVEFQNKFFHADGYAFVPFSFLTMAKEAQGF
jgi:V-type H+-transporting ATPase subunit a